MANVSNLLSDNFGTIRSNQINTGKITAEQIDLLTTSSSMSCVGSVRFVGTTNVFGTTSSSLSFYGSTPIQQPSIQLLDTQTGTPSIYDIAVKVNELIDKLSQTGIVKKT